jgi:outer membrane protein TolC
VAANRRNVDRKKMKKAYTKMIRFMNKIYLAGLLLLAGLAAEAQNSLTLEECYELAAQNFPVIKQKDLIARSAGYTISNLNKGILPQLTLNGQATYQSEVTSIAVNIPGVKFDAPSKDQYKVYADISQPITELFTVKNQKELAEKNAEISARNVDVEIYKLRDRINQLYFGVLLADEQMKLNELVESDLEAGKKRVDAAIKNGVDYKSSLDKIKAEMIKNNQRAIELRAQRKAYTDMLAYFINQPVDEQTSFKAPAGQTVSNINNRPELKVFENRNASYLIQQKIINNKNLPRFSLFVQTGAGKPSPLNMISNSFSPYYIGGIRASWSVMGLYTMKNEKSLLMLDKQANDIQKDIFLFNAGITSRQQSNEIVRLNELIQTDDELVSLRTSVKTTSGIQLENGIITTSDFIREVNAEDQARQTKLLHAIQLLMAKYNLQNTLGN